MEYCILNNGIRMPVLGIGVFQVENPAVCEQGVSGKIRTRGHDAGNLSTGPVSYSGYFCPVQTNNPFIIKTKKI